MANPWVRSWEVVGTSGKAYKVSQRQDGMFGCTCPAWIFSKVKPKPDCQHILQIKIKESIPEQNRVSVTKIKSLDSPEIVRTITFFDE